MSVNLINVFLIYILPSRYALSHIDFHFGSVSTQGSEHTLNGGQSPMEMEMVFYDQTFIDTATAMASTNADALATLSHLFSVSRLMK